MKLSTVALLTAQALAVPVAVPVDIPQYVPDPNAGVETTIINSKTFNKHGQGCNGFRLGHHGANYFAECTEWVHLKGLKGRKLKHRFVEVITLNNQHCNDWRIDAELVWIKEKRDIEVLAIPYCNDPGAKNPTFLSCDGRNHAEEQRAHYDKDGNYNDLPAINCPRIPTWGDVLLGHAIPLYQIGVPENGEPAYIEEISDDGEISQPRSP